LLAFSGCAFFDQNHPTYLRIAAICNVVKQAGPIGQTLRRGRQYARATRVLEQAYTLPGAGELVAWSRVAFQQEVLVAMNTHGSEARGAWVTVGAEIPCVRQEMSVLYRSDWSDIELRNPPQNHVLPLTIDPVDGRLVVHIDLPPAGMLILA
jgi:hypothetical protein